MTLKSNPQVSEPPMAAPSPSLMEINLDSLAHNVREIRRVVGAERLLIGVAKADAYGHGVDRIGPAMLAAGVDVVAVGNLDDAIRLRQAGCTGRLLLFGRHLPAEIAKLIREYDIIPTVWDEAGARTYAEAAAGPLDVYLKIDTGFHRLGVSPDLAARVAAQILAIPNVQINCVYTHFSDPLGKEHANEQEFARFQSVLSAFKSARIRVPYACVASSAVVSTEPEMYLNAVDPGRLFYGFYYPPSQRVGLDLRLVMRSFKSRIIQTRWVEAGESIGYGRKFRAARHTLIGVLPVGWFNGLARSSPADQEVLVRGHRCPRIGAINIEHCLLDLTDIEGASPGDEVVLIGEQQGTRITLQEYSDWMGFTEMESVVRLSATASRIYQDGEHGPNGTFIN